MILQLNLDITPSRGWSYERAFANAVFHREEPDNPHVIETHRQVSKMFGVLPDNKQTFEVLNSIGQRLVLTFHDGRMFVGTEVRPYRESKLPEHDYKPTNP